MKATHAILSVLGVSMLFAGPPILAKSLDSTSYWVGKRFSTQQCVRITNGRHVAKRKLCFITYDVKASNTSYRVDAHMEFRKRYVTPDAEEVELQVLLMDEELVCRKQLNMRSAIENRRATFSFVTENLPTYRYVRTYFVIHYRQ